jgi:HlyD family secretion protein
MARLLTFFKKHYILSTAGIIIVFGGGFLYVRNRNSGPTYDSIVVSRRDITQSVSVTGTVKPVHRVDLAFEKTGKIARVSVKTGDAVKVGQTLVALDASDVAAELAQAQAQVKVQEAKLDGLVRGTRAEELQVEKVKVANADSALTEAKQGLVDALRDAYTKSDDAIYNKVDQFFSSPRSANPQINFASLNLQFKTDVEFARLSTESVLMSWAASLDSLSRESDLTLAVTATKTNLASIAALLNKAATALNSVSGTPTLSQATLDAYRADISTARASINTAISNISTADEKAKSSASARTLAEQELALAQAGATTEDVSGQKAAVDEAKANAQSLRAALDKTVIRSPLNGIVTKEDANVGEIINAKDIVVSLISAGEFEIEANVPEADVAKLHKGDFARVTLDAYGSDVQFSGTVVATDPAETIVEGVPAYKTTFQFAQKDARIRSGMTANIDVMTDKRARVLALPERALVTSGSGKKVRVVRSDGTLEERAVETGLRGSDGSVEITKGIAEGETVVVFMAK